LDLKSRMSKSAIELRWNLKNHVDSISWDCIGAKRPSCEYCRSGNYNLCPDIKFAATPPYDGTLTKYYILPYDMVVPLPENVSLEEGGIFSYLASWC
jgi:threonine dehydrogenase-like Zn-dependent dehydrogenase